MNAPHDEDRLQQAIETQGQRKVRAEHERGSLLAQTVFLGTLALLFVLPVVGGTYLGFWLDDRQPGYSYRWTMMGLAAGLVVGVINVYAYVRTH